MHEYQQRYKTSDGRRLTILSTYEGSDRNDDPSGYYYQFDGERTVHFVSCAGAVARFTKIEQG